MQMPSSVLVDTEKGYIHDAHEVVTCRLSDMKGYFHDSEAEAQSLSDNPLIYRAHRGPQVPSEVNQLSLSTTAIYPGKIGDEYYMTRGHLHAKADRTEVYFTLNGEGLLILQDLHGEVHVESMKVGMVNYIPPNRAHRTVNLGINVLAFLAVYPADAGQNYSFISDKGFAKFVVERSGAPALIDNPNYAK